MSFVHLHLHSEFSLLDGALRVSEIPAAAKSAGMSAVAITDHGVMYGVVDFYKACKKENIKPIIGCEVYTAPRTRFDKTHEADSRPNHLVLLVKNAEGYKNLIYMVSKSFTEGFYSKPRVDLELLREHSGGLCALSGCLAGKIPRLIVSGQYDEALEYAKLMRGIFGDDFYLELQDHGIRDQITVNRAIADISSATGIPMCATNDVHYLKKSDSANQAILLCVQTNSVITDGRPIGFETDEFYFKSESEMTALFGAYEGAIENTQKIADKCNFDFEFGKTLLPRYKCSGGEAPEKYLARLSGEGLEERRKAGHIEYTAEHPESEYRERIAYELSVIGKMGYSEYYLIVWDFVHHAKKKGIPVGPGRGSGAGSLVAYLVGITDIDPIRFGLLFERFLNPERVSMPDFDIDFCYERRDEAIAYVREKYGCDHTSQIITFGTLAARAAVRDVGRAMGMSYAEVDAVAKLIPQELHITLKAALERRELKAAYNEDDNVRELIDMAMALEGMPRNASTHAAGVVITEEPVFSLVPLAVNGDVTVTQYPMETVAELGLLKFDFLALRYLTIIDSAEKQIRESLPDFELSKLPMDDKATYELISNGYTDGVFQLESGGMRQMLMQLRPETIDDIIAAIALYRPGPMDSIPKYIKCRHGREKIKYEIASLAPILDVTYGCIVYQEQVMQIFRTVAGYSLGRADVVRRAISKKKTDVLESERCEFMRGAAQNGISEDAAARLFDDIASFANYAFNKSHAAAYAVISYRTAYLKAHYPKEYNCALLTSVLSSPAKIAEYISECARAGIKILPPDINESMTDFHVSGDNIRFGLLALKNVGRQFIDSIIANRSYGGRYTSPEDFVSRMANHDINKRQLEALIKAGALDGLGVHRSQLLCVYEKLIDKKDVHGVADGQMGLFTGTAAASSVEYPDISEFSRRELLRLEKEASGMYFSGHLLDDYSECVEKIKPDIIFDINASFSPDDNMPELSKRYSDRQRVTVCGIVTKRVSKATKAGEPMAFVTLEDRTGDIELVIFPKALKECTHFMLIDRAVMVTGNISVKDDEAKILLNSASELSENASIPTTAQPLPKKLYIKIDRIGGELFNAANTVVMNNPGKDEVIYYERETKKYNIDKAHRANAAAVIHCLCAICGDGNVVLK